MLRINYIRNNQLNFKSISHLSQKEASEILSHLNVTPNNKNRPKEENYIIRNGNMIKMESQDFNFNTQQTKFIGQSKVSNQLPQKSFQIIGNHARDDRIKEYQTLERKGSFINQFRNQFNEENDRLKDQFCRVWYQKIALQGHYAAVIEDNAKKDQIINQLRLELDIKNNPNQGNIVFNIPNNNQVSQHPHNQSNHNRSLPNNHQHFPMSPSQVNPQSNQPNQLNQVNQPNQWGSVNQNRNFQQSNNGFRKNL